MTTDDRKTAAVRSVSLLSVSWINARLHLPFRVSWSDHSAMTRWIMFSNLKGHQGRESLSKSTSLAVPAFFKPLGLIVNWDTSSS
jgi:hypothetical protein